MDMRNPEELPIHKFHFSMSHLFHISHIQDNLPSDLIRDLYRIEDNYYLESLSILRLSKKTSDRITVEIESKLKESREKIEKLQVLKVQLQDSDQLEWADYLQSRHVSEREFNFKQIELEGEMNSLASIIMFLSLLESTLFSMTMKLIETESLLPEMNTVMNRSDNGIVKYLKYFEKYIEKQEENFIVGTKKYELIRFWLNVRNNIVHSDNLVNQKILTDANRLRIKLSVNHHSNKFRFRDSDVTSIANLCGEILNDCIEIGFYKYFGVDEEQ